MASELKPCPFCHKTAHLKIDPFFEPSFDGYYGFTVVCSAAGFDNTERGCGASGAWGEAEEDAAASWNTRPTPVAPVSPDATGKCGELETVAWQHQDYDDWHETHVPDYHKNRGKNVRELVTRSQAEELLAAERAALPILKGTAFKSGDGWKDTTKEGDICFVWNRMHPAPYAPGQYPRVGKEHWSASIENYTFEPATLGEVSKLFADLKADNAALTARVKGLETDLKTFQDGTADLVNEKIDAEFKAVDLEAKLAAAEEVAQLVIQAEEDKSGDPNLYILLMQTAYDKARAALGGKPS